MSDPFGQVLGAVPPQEEQAAAPVAAAPAPAPAPQGDPFGQVLGGAEAAPPPPQNSSPSPGLGGVPAPQAAAPAPQAAPPPQAAPSPGLGGVPVPPDNRPVWEQAASDLGDNLGRVKDEVIPQAVGDAGKSIAELQAQPSLGDKAGQVVGAFSHLNTKQQARVEQRLEDEITTGSPDTTLGGMGIGSANLQSDVAETIANPEHVKDLPGAVGDTLAHPENILDSRAMDVAESPGGLDSGKQSFADWAREDPARYEAARAKGEGVATQQWKEETGRTLASGGLGGSLSGGGYDIGTDPTLELSGAIGEGVEMASGVALKAGQPLAAGVIRTGGKFAQGALDPTDLVAEPVLRGVANKLTRGGTALTPASQQERVVGGMDEVLGTSARSIQPDPVGPLPSGAPSAATAAPATGAGPNGVPPAAAAPSVPTGAAIASQPMNGSAPPSPAPQPVPASALAPAPAPTPPQPARPTLDLYSNGSSNGVAPSPPTSSQEVMSRMRGKRVGSGVLAGEVDQVLADQYILTRGMTDAERRMHFPAATVDILDEIERSLSAPIAPSVNGNGALGTIGGSRPASSAPARPLQPLMRDGDLRGPRWVTMDGKTPPSFQGIRKSLVGVKPEDAKGFAPGRNVIPTEETAFTTHLAAATEQGWLFNDWPSTRAGGTKKTPAGITQKQAGANWVNLMGQRIEAHGTPEVERLVNELQAVQTATASPVAKRYWEYRAKSIIEAATKAKYDSPFTVTVDGTPHTYTPAGRSAAPSITPPESAAPSVDAAAIQANPLGSTLSRFANATDYVRASMGERLDAIMGDPSGFGGGFERMRQPFYRPGPGGEPAWAKPGTAAAQQWPEALARYQAVRDLHAGTWADAPSSHTLARRGEFIPNLSPDQRLDTRTGVRRGSSRVANVITDIAAESRAHLDAMGLGHVRLRYTDYIDTQTGDMALAYGQFNPDFDEVSLAVGYTSEAVADEIARTFGDGALGEFLDSGEFTAIVKRTLHQTLNHEALHGLRSAQVITDDEWKLLVKEARARGYGDWAMSTYGPDLKTGQQVYQQANVLDAMTKGMDQYDEEAVAEMFGDFASDAKALTPATRTIFQKITDFFGGLVRAVLRQPNGVDVMKQMLSGDVGARIPFNPESRVNPATGQSRYFSAGGGGEQPFSSKVYRGGITPDMEVMRANTPDGEFGYDFAGSTRLGAFSTPDEEYAASYASNKAFEQFGAHPNNVGKRWLYEGEASLAKPYITSKSHIASFDGSPDGIQAAKAFRAKLEAKGYDGIVVHEGRTPNPDGTYTGVGGVEEVISFKDIPISKATQFQRAKRNTALGTMDTSQITQEDPLGGAPDAGTAAMWRDEITYKNRLLPIRAVHQDVAKDMSRLRQLAAHKAASTTPRFAGQKELTALTKRFDADAPGADWGAMSDDEIRSLSTEHTRHLWEAAKYPTATGAPKKPSALGGVGDLVSDWTAANRRLRLTALASGPQQAVRQFFGNLFSASLVAPEGVVGQFNPGFYRSVLKGLKTPDGHSDYVNFLIARRGAAPQRLNTRTKSMAGYETGIKNPTIKKAVDLLAPKWMSNIVQASDGVATEAMHYQHYVLPMKEELRAAPKMGGKVMGAYQGKYKGDFPAITPRQVEDVIRETINVKKVGHEPISRVTGEDVKAALIAKFEHTPVVGGDQKVADKALRDFADRVGRNLNEADNRHFQQATQKVNKVYQSWENLNVDEHINKVLLFTYWASRSSGTYAKAMIRKPYVTSALMNLTEQVQQEAEAHNYPDWMKGYTKLLNSPAGLTLYMNPLDAISTMFVFADWQYGEGMPDAIKGDLTWLGTLRGVLPALIAAPVDYVTWLAGGYGGEDARMPYNVTGLTPLTRRVAQVLNLAGEAGLLPLGMGQDAQGNFHPFNETPLEDVAAHIGAVLGRPVAEGQASLQARQEQHLQQILIDNHPEWATDPQGADKLLATTLQMKNDAAAGTYSPEWLEAEQAANGDATAGPDFSGLPEPLRFIFDNPVVEGAVRALTPIRMMSEPTIKTQLRDGNVPVGVNDEFDAKQIKNTPYDTLEVANTKALNEGWWDVGADTGLKDASRVYHNIGNGTIDAPITIYGKTYSKESLADGVMTETQRYDVAKLYLDSQGFTPSDLDAYDAARDKIEAANPDLAAFHDFTTYVHGYAGGEEAIPNKAFVDAAVQSSPSYARYMQRTGYPPGSADYYKAGDSAEAFYALEGKPTSIYDPTELPDKGTIPGQPTGVTFSVMRAFEANADAVANSGSGGDGSTYDDFVGDVQKNVDNLYNAQQMVDAWFPGAGYQAGVTRFDYDTYKAMQAAGYNAPAKGDIAYEYNDWLLSNATTADPSVKAFLDQRERTTDTATGTAAPVENVTPQMIAEQHGRTLDVVDSAVPRTADGAIDTASMPWVAMNQEMPLYSGPSFDAETPLVLQGPTVNAAGVPVGGLRLKLVRRSADGQWAEVIGPGNQVGWVPTVVLNTA